MPDNKSSLRHSPLASSIRQLLGTASLGLPLVLHGGMAWAQPVALGPEELVNTITAGWQSDPRIAMDAEGDFVVVWEDYASGAYEIYAQLYAATGTKLGPAIHVSNDMDPDCENYLPDVATDTNGDFVVVWTANYCDEGEDGDYEDVYARRYSALGVAQGGSFRVNNDQDDDQDEPVVAMDAAGNFVVVWEDEDRDGDGEGVYGQKFFANGTEDGGEFLVNELTGGDQDEPAIAMNGAGTFAVVWEDDEGDDIYGRVYPAGGSPGSAFLISSPVEGASEPDVDMDTAGDFVVVWETNETYSFSAQEVYARRYFASGAPKGGEFLVSPDYGDEHDDARVAVNDANGDFVIVWETGYYYDGTLDVYLRYYNSSGVAQGGAQRANNYTSDNQEDVDVAIDIDGDFVVGWESYDQPPDGDDDGVFIRRFQPEAPTPVEVAPVPTLGQYALGLLSALLGVFGMRRLLRRREEHT